jgi:creatinine amidohydrolase
MRKTRGAKQSFPVRWEELTASDFPKAVKRAKGVCVLPIGVIEKHGPHLPLGTDVIAARAASVAAAEREYAVVFPWYCFGQIFEGTHVPGAVALKEELLTPVLQNVCDEIARNGLDKILIVNGHGGNNHWLSYFTQVQLRTQHDYSVYLAQGYGMVEDEEVRTEMQERWEATGSGHADEVETSVIMAVRPELVQLAQAGDEDGRAKGRLKHLPGITTGIWWYADFPDHYAGDARKATAALGQRVVEATVGGLVDVIAAVKKDTSVARLQSNFFEQAERPTEQRRRKAKR